MEYKEDNTIGNNGMQTQPTTEELIVKYENELLITRERYKKASLLLQCAGDSFEEECIKDDLEVLKKEVKSLRIKIDTLIGTRI